MLNITNININTLPKEAFLRTKKIASDYYWGKVLGLRFEKSKDRAGSFFTGFETKEELAAAVENDSWVFCPELSNEATAIFRSTSFSGREGVIKISEIDSNEIKHIESPFISGRFENVFYIQNDEELPVTNEAYLVVSFKTPEGNIDYNAPFIPTILVGSYLGPNDTVVNIGKYAKLVKNSQ